MFDDRFPVVCKTGMRTLLLGSLRVFTRVLPVALFDLAGEILEVECFILGLIFQVSVGLKYNISPAICTCNHQKQSWLTRHEILSHTEKVKKEI